MAKVRSVFPSARAALIAIALLNLLLHPGPCAAASVLGHTIYVPAYSMAYTGDRAVPVNLASTLSIRNRDRKNSITLSGVDYHASDGRLVRRMLAKPRRLPPLASTSIFIKAKDTAGGFSPSFLVSWEAGKEVTPPLVECVNIGAYSGLGISFVSQGEEIR